MRCLFPTCGYCWSFVTIRTIGSIKTLGLRHIRPTAYKQLVLIETKPAEAGFVDVTAPFYGDGGISVKRGYVALLIRQQYRRRFSSSKMRF